MAHFGTLDDYRFADQDRDIRGTLLYGEDNEKLGAIHDVIFDHETGTIKYAVIDTGGWLRHHYFLVPANRIMPYEKHEDHFYAKLRKEQIEALPPYDPDVVKDHGKWTDYETRYHQAWNDDEGILHAEGSSRIITPEPDQVVGAGSADASSSASRSGINVADVFPERIAPHNAPATGPATTLHPQEQTATSAAVNPNPFLRRWESFSTAVRQDLPHIRKTCTSCGCADDRERKAS